MQGDAEPVALADGRLISSADVREWMQIQK